jgi:hypothetical protein
VHNRRGEYIKRAKFRVERETSRSRQMKLQIGTVYLCMLVNLQGSVAAARERRGNNREHDEELCLLTRQRCLLAKWERGTIVRRSFPNMHEDRNERFRIFVIIMLLYSPATVASKGNQQNFQRRFKMCKKSHHRRQHQR